MEDGECSVIVGEDGGEEWGERIEEACEQEGNGGECECSVIVGADGLRKIMTSLLDDT